VTALVAGIDFSSKAIHASIIPLDEDTPLIVATRVGELPAWPSGKTTPEFRSVERARAVRHAVAHVLADVWGDDEPGGELHYIAHAAVEIPFGHKTRSTVLWELYGAILATIPPRVEREAITTHEWRRIVAPIKLRMASEEWKAWAVNYAHACTGWALSEHHAEAYLIARAARARMWNATAA
jgi:hypothetical protein